MQREHMYHQLFQIRIICKKESQWNKKFEIFKILYERWFVCIYRF